MWLASWLWSTQCPPCVGRGEGERRAKVLHLFMRTIVRTLAVLLAFVLVLGLLILANLISHGRI